MSGAHEVPTNLLEGHLLHDPTSACVMIHVRGLVLRRFLRLNILQAIVSMLHHNLDGLLSADKQRLCNTFGLLCRGVAGILCREGAQTGLPPHLIEDTRRLVCNLTVSLVERAESFIEGLVLFIAILA